LRGRVRLMLLGVLLIGCASGPTAPEHNTDPPKPAEVAPAPKPASLVIEGNPGDLQPFFAAVRSSFDDIFMVQGKTLYRVTNGSRVEVLTGPRPAVLALDTVRALVTDGEKLYWFDLNTGEVTEFKGVPTAQRAVQHGGTYLLQAGKDVFLWTPDRSLSKLAPPEHHHAVYGISISPDGRYGAIAYDLDIPNGPRSGVVWVYDLKTGEIHRWPNAEPKLMYGLWLLGWSEPNILRFQTGSRGNNLGHTWQLPDGDPSSADGSQYQMMEGAWLSHDGSWMVYRSAADQVVVQSSKPESKPLMVHKESGGLYDVRILLNGHLAFRTGTPRQWWEVLPDGTVNLWEKVDFLF
jgi:WD40 repeat protein